MNQIQLRSCCTPGLPNDAVQLEILHLVNTPSLAKLQHTRIVVLGSSILWERLQSCDVLIVRMRKCFNNKFGCITGVLRLFAL